MGGEKRIIMYVVYIRKVFINHEQGEYAFDNKEEVQKFLESLNAAELEGVTEIQHFTKRGCRNAWKQFFN